MASDPATSDFYVYAHSRADTGEVIYIGKGRGRRAHARHGRNSLWTRIASKHGVSVAIWHHGLTEQRAFDVERQTIAAMRPICNFTDGGEGISGYRHSEATKEALREAHSGRKQDPAVVEARAAKLRGKKRKPEVLARWVCPMKGRKHSEETRAKMSLAHAGRPASPTAIAKTVAKHRGMKRSDEARANMSDAQPKRRVVSLTNGDEFDSLSSAAAYLRAQGFERATKGGVWAACKRNGTYLGHSWAYADGPA